MHCGLDKVLNTQESKEASIALDVFYAGMIGCKTTTKCPFPIWKKQIKPHLTNGEETRYLRIFKEVIEWLVPSGCMKQNLLSWR